MGNDGEGGFLYNLKGKMIKSLNINQDRILQMTIIKGKLIISGQANIYVVSMKNLQLLTVLKMKEAPKLLEKWKAPSFLLATS